jgi:2-dehydropantoate 2-reductase
VVAVSLTNAHLRAIATAGLRLTGASGDRVIPLVTQETAPAEVMDLVVIATKSFHAAAAARGALPMIGDDTVVLTIQNGLGASEQVAEVVGTGRLAVGIAAAFGASLPAPGHAHHENTGKISMGAYADLPLPRMEAIAAVWADAGMQAEAVPDIAAMQWEKLICNVAYSGLCGITGHTVGAIMDSPDLGPVSRAAAAEAHAIARAAGVALRVEDPVALALAFGEKVRGAKPSVLLDIEAGRASEIAYINGAIDRVAQGLGLRAPVNATLTALVRDREARLAGNDG